MEVKIIPAYDHQKEIGELFAEYTQMLIDGDSAFWDYLAVQHYDAELAHLEEKYGMPDGRLYLALCDGKAAGCIGLRRLDRERCEMKRLYVRPGFRGARIGERLVEKLIAEAREIGYSRMMLDTLPFLESAVRLYKKHGFSQCESYNDSPMESSIYMRLDL